MSFYLKIYSGRIRCILYTGYCWQNEWCTIDTNLLVKHTFQQAVFLLYHVIGHIVGHTIMIYMKKMKKMKIISQPKLHLFFCGINLWTKFSEKGLEDNIPGSLTSPSTALEFIGGTWAIAESNHMKKCASLIENRQLCRVVNCPKWAIVLSGWKRAGPPFPPWCQYLIATPHWSAAFKHDQLMARRQCWPDHDSHLQIEKALQNSVHEKRPS